MKRRPFRNVRFFGGAFLAVTILFGVGALADVRGRSKATGPIVVAQFGLGDVLGAGKDFAVKQALSSFGKSIGAQLPIVVDPNDAYPTTTALGGAPFSPAAAPDVAGLLHDSSDGTIGLPPGDFAFPVDVFCMQAHAGSPSGHRYLVAPLHGSAADIVTALNSRIPSYSIDHHVLQVLSWDIQAGMAYSAMQAAQRAAVDRIIPDYRGRLDGDVYERIHDQYTQVAQRVPGMPSFEEALERVGPIGAEVVALQSLRQQLEQPPPTFAQLARSLVPELPGAIAGNVSGETPWSRYSDRVFVRFTTAGNYATPGTYQVRVLAQPSTADLGPAATLVSFANYSDLRSDPPAPFFTPLFAAASFASVPFSNIVNNPGTNAVQPLTQTPVGSPSRLPPTRRKPRKSPPPSPSPSPSPTPYIRSETIAYQPANRDRKTVGVGEQVTLTFSEGSARWNFRGLYDSAVIRPSDGSIEPVTGPRITYTAASIPAIETITARGAHNAEASITFYVIAPSGVVDRRFFSSPIKHHQGRPDSGLDVESYLTPDSVSFQNVSVLERNVDPVATGVYVLEADKGHSPNPIALPATNLVVPGLGTKMNWIDQIYSGDWMCPKPPFAPGALVLHIPTEYQLSSGGDFHPFATVIQASVLQADGTTLESTKAGAGVTVSVPDPTTTSSPGCPP